MLAQHWHSLMVLAFAGFLLRWAGHSPFKMLVIAFVALAMYAEKARRSAAGPADSIGASGLWIQ